MSYQQVEELVERINIFTRNDGIAVEIYEKTPGDFPASVRAPFIARVRVFEPTPGLEPEESIMEVLMTIDGTDPNGEPLVEIVLDEADGDVIYISPHAAAIAAILLA